MCGVAIRIEDFYPHKLRHSFASIANTNGADVVSVSERLTHSDTAVTLQTDHHAIRLTAVPKRSSTPVPDALTVYHAEVAV